MLIRDINVQIVIIHLIVKTEWIIILEENIQEKGLLVVKSVILRASLSQRLIGICRFTLKKGMFYAIQYVFPNNYTRTYFHLFTPEIYNMHKEFPVHILRFQRQDQVNSNSTYPNS